MRLKLLVTMLVHVGALLCRRSGGAAEERSNEPKSFKRFLLENVPENVGPMEAQQLYEQYLTEHFGDQLRAKFEQEKTLDS